MKRIIFFAVVLTALCTLYSCFGRAKKTGESAYGRYLNNSQSYDLMTLPFALEEYLIFFHNHPLRKTEKKYPFYTPGSDLESYLKSIDYQGEEYKCFIIPSGNPELILFLTWVLRGDSEYYLAITANEARIENYLECGITGVDDPIYFVLDENLEITRLQKTESGFKEIDKYRIQPTGKITKKEGETPDTEDESDLFVRETDWESVVCKQYREADGYNTIQECVFPNANMQQIYNIVKKIDPNLKPELPLSDLKYPSTKNGCIEVSYQYKTEKHLFVELVYQGGVTSIEIVEKEGETQSTITYSAD